MKNGKSIKDAILKPQALNHHAINLAETEAHFYWRSQESTPPWAQIFSTVPDLDQAQLKGKSLQGLLLVERHSRIFCFTFGHGRHLLDQLYIERHFGMKVALSLTDPDLIKQIDKLNIDKTPLNSRSQSSKYTSISEFEFKFDWEILKSLTGVVQSKNDDDYEVVSGSDSVSLYTNITLQSLPKLIDRLWAAYNDTSYKSKYPWIDYISPVKDKEEISDLDQELVNKINHKKYNEIWAAPPEIVDHENFSGYCYKQRSGKSSQTTEPDLDLKNCLSSKKIEGQVTLERLKSTRIFLYDSGDNVITHWPLYLCLNGEIVKNGVTYLLTEGHWFKVDDDFCSQINDYFNSFPHSDIKLPNYQGKQEDKYLEYVTKSGNFHLMDRKLVAPPGAGSRIEFCDMLTNDHDLIHVKKYSSSSVLSHLFSQAYVSAETLVRAPEIIDQVNDHLKDNPKYSFVFDSKHQPRKSKIIIAIMQKRTGNLHMPFFSKVNFKHHSQKLVEMGFTVLLKKIDF